MRQLSLPFDYQHCFNQRGWAFYHSRREYTINGSKSTTSTADWPMHESYWHLMTHGEGYVDLNIRDDEDGLQLIVYQASDDAQETECCDDKTWRVFNLVEKDKS